MCLRSLCRSVSKRTSRRDKRWHGGRSSASTVPHQKLWIVSLWGLPRKSLGENHFRDHATTYTFGAALKSRSEVPEKIMSWIHHLNNSMGKFPVFVQSDNAAEYIGPLRNQLDTLGSELAPVTPFQPPQ